MIETQQVIYSMVRVGRIHPPNRQVLRDISLGFFYGAKIGVLGLNGSGKSTLLRIMAGVDKDYLGETMLTKGYTRGLLPQEPQLDAGKTVRQVVEEAVQPIVDLLRKYDEINERFGTIDPDDMEALLDEQARVQAEIDKTIRGILVSLVATPLAAWLIGLSWHLGVVVAALAIAGDLLSSFVKRRMGLASSSMAIGLDQIPESLLPLLGARLFMPLSLLDVLVGMAIFFTGELILSRILFHLNLRDRPY